MPLIVQNGTGISAIWFPDWMQDPFNIGIQAVVTQTATFNIEHTLNNIDVAAIGPFSGNSNATTAANATWIANPGISSATTNINGNYAFPVRAIRLNILSAAASAVVTVMLIQNEGENIGTLAASSVSNSGNLLLADGASSLLLADGSSKLVLAGG